LSQEKISLVDTGIYILKKKIKGENKLKPRNPLPAETIDVKKLDLATDQVFWLGHSAALLILNQKVILLDPMLGKHASPLPIAYPRFEGQRPLDLAEFEWIDLVLFTHNHYDHLDKSSILKIKNKVELFLVPVGMKNTLVRWGIAPKRVKEISWNQDVLLDELTITATPTQHSTGRGLFDQNKSQANSWVLKSPKTSLFLSGDSSYADHFKEIGNQYGPFDLALMECGQYNPKWKESHMFPDETVSAVIDSQAKKFIPIHWAGFALSFHPWQEPVEKASQEAVKQGIQMDTPMIGQQYKIHAENVTNKWWRKVD